MTPETAQQLAADWARSGGHTLTSEGMATVAERIATTLERDASGFTYRDEAFNETFRIENGATIAVPVGEWVAGLMQRHGTPVPKPTTIQVAPTLATIPKPNTVISAFGRALDAAHTAAMAKECAAWPNPWAKGQENRTRQNIIRNHNPALAARHQAQAGV